MADRAQSPAYGALRASSRRLLLFIEHEIARQGDSVTLYADQLALIGSRRVVLPGLSELTALGLIDWRRLPKRHVISLSDRWRTIETATQATSVSAVAREQREPLLLVSPALMRSRGFDLMAGAEARQLP